MNSMYIGLCVLLVSPGLQLFSSLIQLTLSIAEMLIQFLFKQTASYPEGGTCHTENTTFE